MREPKVSLGLNMEVGAEGYHSTHDGCQPKCLSSSHCLDCHVPFDAWGQGQDANSIIDQVAK